nr:MAG TPA: Carbamoyl-phosphate synthetase large chain, oligomerization domain [Bacteriophage sp.]
MISNLKSDIEFRREKALELSSQVVWTGHMVDTCAGTWLTHYGP